jgi:hypothetical protein
MVVLKAWRRWSHHGTRAPLPKRPQASAVCPMLGVLFTPSAVTRRLLNCCAMDACLCILKRAVHPLGSTTCGRAAGI